MAFSTQYSAVALGCSMVLVGCGSGTIVDQSATANTSDTAIIQASEGTFFNERTALDFAGGIGTGLTSVVTRAFTSSNGELTAAAQNNDPTTGVFNDETSVEQCDSGTISSSFGSGENGDFENGSIVFSDCVTDGQTTSGAISFSADSSSSSESEVAMEFADFGSTGPLGDSFIDGDIALSIREDLSSSISGSELTMTADGETTVFSNFLLDTSFDTDSMSIDGGATIASTVDGTVDISINPAFVTPMDSAAEQAGNPTTGIMRMTHSDGSSLTIDANTGNDDTFAYVISGNGSVTTGVGMWDDEDLEIPFVANGSVSNSGL